ncbi:GATA zinc finger domain-containing protein 16 [Camponotus floridanus]|uniref:GATA zinc finger domain-containing protein 16 n=1 Tax=Camponotus floridanus TaxID=104421 RepID=UPI00059BCAA6|nr:GATA zinc finger domain-containing protein 16 [Camponotus floridanus]
MNKYILILLLSAIALTNVQAASNSNEKSSEENSKDTSDDSENNTTISIDDDNKNDSSANTDDGNNKNNTSVNTDNDNGINNTSTNTGDDNDNNNSINTGDDNNTSVNTDNDNGKNDTSAGTNNGKIPDKDVKHDIRIITECMIRSKSIGNIVMHITRLTKIVFFVVPSLRNPFMNYFYAIFEIVFNRLIQLNIWLQYLEAIIRRILPFSASSILFP